MTVLTKKPGEKLDFAIDISDPLGVDTISTVVWTLTGGLVESSKSNTTTVATIVVTGGDFGAVAEINGTVTTASGNIHVESCVIRIIQ